PSAVSVPKVHSLVFCYAENVPLCLALHSFTSDDPLSLYDSCARCSGTMPVLSAWRSVICWLSAGAVSKRVSFLGHWRARWCTRYIRRIQSGLGRAPGPRRRPTQNSLG